MKNKKEKNSEKPKKEKKKAPIQTVIEKGNYHFNEKEKNMMSRELAQKQIDKRIVEDEKKSMMSDYKDRLDRFVWEINRLSRCVIDGYEIRDFECYIEMDYKAHLKKYVDIHTKRVINERPLDPSDYQTEMKI